LTVDQLREVFKEEAFTSVIEEAVRKVVLEIKSQEVALAEKKKRKKESQKAFLKLP
jgi:hypothetical protein